MPALGPGELASCSGPAPHGQHGLGQVPLPAARRAGGPKAFRTSFSFLPSPCTVVFISPSSASAKGLGTREFKSLTAVAAAVLDN